MRHRQHWLIIAIAAAVAAGGGRGAIAAPPASIKQFAQSNSLDETQTRQVREYAQHWAERLGSQDLAEIDAARRALLDPLSGFNVSPYFRNEYGKAMLDRLRTAARDQRNHLGAYNAVQVLGRLATVDALNALVNHVDRRKEPRVAIRIAAAKAIRMVFEDARPEEITAQTRAAPVRELVEAARHEDDAFVVLHQLDTIGYSGRDDELFQAFDVVLDTMEARNEASGFMTAVRPSILTMRSMFLDRPRDLKPLAQKIMPLLHRLLYIAEKHWDSVQNDPERLEAYQGTIDAAEALLQSLAKALDVMLEPPTQLAETYGRNRQRYSDDLRRIEAAIPP